MKLQLKRLAVGAAIFVAGAFALGWHDGLIAKFSGAAFLCWLCGGFALSIWDYHQNGH